MNLEELQSIKKWHVRHRDDHPVEYHLWDALLTLWLMGWVGWIPAFVFEAVWAAPLCIVAMAAPGLYVTWRRNAHRANKLRCDWVKAF
jgi:hypothetical protein